MKKLLVIFIVFFGIIPVSGHSLEPSYDTDLYLDDNGYAYNGSCKVTTEKACSDDDDACLFLEDGKSCYVADRDGREKYCQLQLVCILETAENKVTRFSKTSACWWADTSQMRNDIFLYYIDRNLDIKECKNSILKYNPKNSAGKTKVFIKDNETKIITDKEGKIAKSLVSNYTATGSIYTAGLAEVAYKTIAQNVCYGYVCTDETGKYKPACPDGSCGECSTNDIATKAFSIFNTNYTSTDASDTSDDSSAPATPKLTPPHSAKPYMNKLKAKYKISAK